ncbi:hypothetical protein LQ757_15620 [Agromyces sp. SYSU K20354]|uniref:hypothetical protein n=1 Tax=Agromyces cavernae TaxID=2898659 RepID=UPI001E3426E8|nr:hypothetical protein [Agromyces cavernae]MCD2443709.1 hypothetical protein [Agromyces cavernae]
MRIRTGAFLALLIAVIAAIRAPFRRAKGAKKDSPPPAEKPEGAKKDSPPPAEKPDFPTSVRVAALAYFGLLIAVLAGLGIQGDLLARLIRNDPVVFAWAVVATLVGGAAAAIVLLWPKAPAARWVLALSAAVALVGVCWAVIVGTASLSVREKPSLDLSVVAKDANTVTVTADAAASSMRAKETLLLRLIAFTDSASKHPRVSEAKQAELKCLADTAQSLNYVLLYWGDTGVTVAGVASTQWKADVEINGAYGEIRYICAKAVISEREEPGGDPKWRRHENRFVWAIADVTLVPSTSPPPTTASR